MAASTTELIKRLSTSNAPDDTIQATAQGLESTEEGRAWLKATAEVEQKYKHKAFVPAADATANSNSVHANAMLDSGAYKSNASASGNFWSRPIPFWSKVGLEVKSDNLRRKYKVEDDAFWLAAPGFQAGTMYYNDIGDLSESSDCFVGTWGPYLSVTFSKPSNGHYVTFQAANVGLPNLPAGIPIVQWKLDVLVI